MKHGSPAISSVIAIGLALFASAATYHQTVNVTAGNSDALVNLAYWGGASGVAPAENDELVSDGNYQLRVKGAAFPGNSL